MTKQQLFLHDVGSMLREKAIDARNSAAEATGTDRDFENGRVMAYSEVLALLQQQAKAFELPLDSMCLADIDPVALLNIKDKSRA